MKQFSVSIIADYLEAVGVGLPAGRLEQCHALLQWLAPSAEHLGFTQYGDPGDFFAHITAPGLLLLPHIPGDARDIAEIGPGSGGAGLVIALLRPDLHVHLIDRSSRVCTFLDIAAARFEIENCSTRCADVDAIAAESPRYDLVTARAVAPPDEIVPSLLSLVHLDAPVAIYHSPDDCVILDDVSLEARIDTGLPNLVLSILRQGPCNR
ncbi:MAG: RsmG family class I SAM-dependent methyltransferase [Armatimonadota bacterium]